MSKKTLHIDWIVENTMNECHYNERPHKNWHRKTFHDEKNRNRFVGEGDTSEGAMTSMLNLMRLAGYEIIGLNDKIYIRGEKKTSKSIFIRVDKEIEVGDFVRCIKADYLGVPGTVGKAEYVCHFNPSKFIVVGCKTPMLRNKWEVVHELKIGDKVLFQGSGPYKVTDFAWDLKETPVLIENPWDYEDCQHVSEYDLELHPLEKYYKKNSLNTIDKIETWAKEKSLDKADPKAQLCKLLEEAGELAEGIIKDRPEQIKDSIGDCVVVLTILALQVGLTIEECVDYAYDQIKERTGKMVNGVFVKSEDLKEG